MAVLSSSRKGLPRPKRAKLLSAPACWPRKAATWPSSFVGSSEFGKAFSFRAIAGATIGGAIDVVSGFAVGNQQRNQKKPNAQIQSQIRQQQTEIEKQRQKIEQQKMQKEVE